MSSIKRILCPVDFSPASTFAAVRAVELATEMGAELAVVHVIDEGTYFLEASHHARAFQFEDYERAVKEKLTSLTAELGRPNLTIEVRVLEGRAHHAIVEAANQLKADLIVMGTHGRSGLGHLFLGSVTERVVRTAQMPVMTVRTKD